MTDIAKAIAFATHCLKWPDVSTAENMQGTLVCDGSPGSILGFNPDSAADLEAVLTEFLGKRYFIQINRDKTGLFQWQVIVGQQGLITPGARFDHAQAQGDDLREAIFDACVDAAKMDRRERDA